MKEVLQWAALVASVLLPFAGYLTIRLEMQNRRLRAELARQIRDSIALWWCENAACDLLALKMEEGMGMTGLAMKRFIRVNLRAQGIQTPSDQAQPHKLEGKLREYDV